MLRVKGLCGVLKFVWPSLPEIETFLKRLVQPNMCMPILFATSNLCVGVDFCGFVVKYKHFQIHIISCMSIYIVYNQYEVILCLKFN